MNKNLTICSLRQDMKFKVRVLHERVSLKDGQLHPINLFKINKLQSDISSFGGKTTIQVTSPKGENYEAVAKCSNKDQFDRRKANMIALGRISKELNI